MAENKSTVYLGYVDEEITDKHFHLLNSTLNKIGGTPDWPNGAIKIPVCPLCGGSRSLIVQIYAPLEISQFHRTLYIFTCLHPVCSQNSKSWLCIRTQHLDMSYQYDNVDAACNKKNWNSDDIGDNQNGNKQSNTISWCSGMNDWDNNTEIINTVVKMDMDTDNHYRKEKNGNIIKKSICDVNKIYLGCLHNINKTGFLFNEKDDDDDSNSTDNELINNLQEMNVNAICKILEDSNANCSEAETVITKVSNNTEYNYTCSGSATVISAEIDEYESDVVLVESLQKPKRDLLALIKNNSISKAFELLSKLSELTLKPHFISVEIENNVSDIFYGDNLLSVDHICELYQKYIQQNEILHSPLGEQQSFSRIPNHKSIDNHELYEKATPAHGDLIFYHFLRILQKNPGQILRYSRDALPLLIAPLQETIPKCPNCNGETLCEIQILPTLISSLKIQENLTPAPIEYGNVLVYTCLKSCWDTPDKMRYERIIVQGEKFCN